MDWEQNVEHIAKRTLNPTALQMKHNLFSQKKKNPFKFNKVGAIIWFCNEEDKTACLIIIFFFFLNTDITSSE